MPNAWAFQRALALRSSDTYWPVVLMPVPRHPCLPQHRQAGGLLSVFSSQLTWPWALEERVGQSIPPRVSGLPGPNHCGMQVGRLAVPTSLPAQEKLITLDSVASLSSLGPSVSLSVFGHHFDCLRQETALWVFTYFGN